MLITSELQKLASEKVINFDGVFPIDNLPITHKKEYKLIVNTDPQNLTGSHWISVIIRPDNTGYVFDPLGYPPSNYIQNWLNLRNVKWTCNLRQVQPSDSILCGYYCVYFLHFIDYNPLKYEMFANVINVLFPKNIPLAVNDNIVLETIKNK